MRHDRTAAADTRHSRSPILILLGILATAIIATLFLRACELRAAQQRKSPFLSVLPSTDEELAFRVGLDRRYSGGTYYKPLRFLHDIPGVSQPKLLAADEVDLPDRAPVVGIEVDGEACAFELQAMLRPDKHIVNLQIGRTPVSVTYCGLVNCVRVLTSETEEAIPLRVGGLDIDGQLVLLLHGERYGQESSGLPLRDLPFMRTDFGCWKEKHPETRVFTTASWMPGE